MKQAVEVSSMACNYSLKGVILLPSMKQEPLEQVLSEYDLKVSSITSENYKDKKGVWWIQTTAGNKILKKISNSESTLRYILSAVNYLSANGANLPAIVKTRSGQEFVSMDEVNYVLWEAVEGRNPSYSSPTELASVVKGLANFHHASTGFQPPAGSIPKIHLGTWIEDYTRQVEDMNNFYKEEQSKKENNAFGKIVLAEFPGFYDRARKAIEGLKGKEYAQWVEKAEKNCCLCHQDFAAGNLLLNPSGKLYILDTDSITLDIPARDIRKLLNKVMKKNGHWDPELTQRMFGYYQAVHPLTPSEWQVVKLDLTFPHLFIGAMNKYFYRRDKEWTEDKYLKRMKEMSTFEKTISPILEHFNSLIPQSSAKIQRNDGKD